ncbi:J domain-containing protein required for chloroplast accumulation response like [Actinidia chinensis var. chinensis]|uniref:J domain-containing protein required for chloroplast accumulation response like n=1 Tax=Actinidia chinensis var. chinensis TaxID=1590841 RepID=A0A2R6PB29_ACTCC|nr:J domain-containing protein required for chloroplast accumulation response like [Actinidia chinensis var. chinensis]
MRGKGKSVGPPQSRTRSERNTLKRCKNNGGADNIVLIDVDSDYIDNVIIIDVPESIKKKLRGSSVICIDDDESSDSNHHGVGEEGGGHSYHDASSSGNCTQNFVDPVGDECQFVHENTSPLKLSKCKRTYSGKGSSRSRYGLGPGLDCGLSDNDCEFMEDSFGKLREQWEKANMRKNYDVRNGKSGRSHQASTSSLHTDTQQKVELENLTEQQTEAQASPSSGNVRQEKENPSPFAQPGDGNLESTFNIPKKTTFSDFGLKSTQETQFSNSMVNNVNMGESFPVEPPFNNAEEQTNKLVKLGSSGFLDEEDQCSRGPSLCSGRGPSNEHINLTKSSSQHKKRTRSAEPCLTNPEPTVDINFGCTRGICESRAPNKSKDTCNSSVDNEKLSSGEPSFKNTKPSNEMRANEVGAVPKQTFHEGPPLRKSGIRYEKGCCQDTVKPVPREPSLCNAPHNEVHTDPNMGAMEISGELMSNHQQQEETDGLLHSQDGNVTDTVGSLIDEREKLKETDEYKRAVEEEWASRQRELQLQAEQARKLRQLRKRMNAESMRLLEMERRQKQRVEEVRDIQKKDEENLNMKEQIRAEVRKELSKLEKTCRDMASLLRGLGIKVGGGFQPLPHEVRAAYKRALLSFHPDRASGSDIRQLVEAEEKFKLISCMKEKFFPAS